MPPVQWQAFIAQFSQFSQFSQFVAAPAPGRHRRVAGRRGAGCRHRPDRAAGATPASHTDTFEGQKMVGDHWSVAGKTALLVVPCVIVSDECNVLLNPRHAAAATITASTVRRWQDDPRFFP